MKKLPIVLFLLSFLGLCFSFSSLAQNSRQSSNKNEQANKSERKSSDKKTDKQQDDRKKRYEATKALKREVEKLERDIENLEQLIEELEVALGDEKIYSNSHLSAEKNKEYENSKNKLEEVYAEWTEKSEKLESIEKEFS